MNDFNRRRAQFDKDFNRTKRFIEIAGIVVFLLTLAFLGAMVYAGYRIFIFFFGPI